MEGGVEVTKKNVFEFNETSELSEGIVWGENKKEVLGKLGLKKRPMIGVLRGRRILKDIRNVEEVYIKEVDLANEGLEVKQTGEQPRFSVLKNENGENFIEMEFVEAGVSVVMSESLEERIGLDQNHNNEKVKGYGIKHILIKGDNGKFLDINSTVPKDQQIETLMTLSTNNKIPEGSFSYYEHGGEPAFLSMSFLRLNKNKEYFWDVKEAGFEYLHESGHDLIRKAGRRRDGIETERDTNALALLRAREINKRVGGDFFDILKLRGVIQDQLKTGYDGVYKGYVASSEARKLLRQREGTQLKKIRAELAEKM